jgi:adenylate cyclase
MKAIIQSTMSFLEPRFSTDFLKATDHSGCALVAGYSGLSEPEQFETASDGPTGRLVAILYADIAERPGATTADDIEACQRLLKARQIFKSCIAAFQGKLAHFTGDSVLAEFSDVESAVQCAANVQIAMRKRNACLRHDRQVRFRIGINLCEVSMDQIDQFDCAVNLVAQLERLAQSGGICVSRSARESLHDRSKLRFVSLGKRHLQNLREPVEAFWIEMDKSRVFDVDRAKSEHSLALVS